MEFPDKLSYFIGNKSAEIDNISMSGAAVYLFDNMVLKVQNDSLEADNEYKMMRWLVGKLPVPEVIEYVKTNKLSYLLMSKCSGKSACDDTIMSKPKKLTQLFADTLNQLWNINTNDCPVYATLEQKLQIAENNVIHGLVDKDDCEPDTFGKQFKDPEALLYWLKENHPEEEPVLSHGDLCLPNIFFNDGRLSGLIDLGRSGRADKWCDITICNRSLNHNYNGVYTGVCNYDYKESYFWEALNIKPDKEKIRYYLLLDELF